MNIYLDIDGVLLANERFAAKGADEFLRAVLNKYPDSTYWLTTHCWRGDNHAVEYLAPTLKPETTQLLHKIKPTEWGELKTDAIDFSQPFLWFDDDLLPEEAEVLRAHGTRGSHVLVNLYRDPEQLKALRAEFFPETP